MLRPIAKDPPLSASKLAEAIAHPERCVGVRIPTYPAMTATATTQHRGYTEWNYSAGTGTSQSYFGLFTRSPVYPVWMSSNPGNKFAYQASWSSKVGASAQSLDYQNIRIEVQEVIDWGCGDTATGVDAPNLQPRVTNSILPTFAKAFSQPPPLMHTHDVDNPGCAFMYIPAGTVLVQSYWMASPVSAGNFQGSESIASLEFLNRGGETNLTEGTDWFNYASNCICRVAKVSVGGWARPGAANIAVNGLTSAIGSMYAALTVVNLNQVAGITISGDGSLGVPPTINAGTSTSPDNQFKLLPLPSGWEDIYDFSYKAFESVRLTGFRATCTNIANIVKREGMFRVGAIEDGELDVWQAAASATTVTSTLSALPAERLARVRGEDGFSLTVPPGSNFQAVRSYVNETGKPLTLKRYPHMNRTLGDMFVLWIYVDPDITTGTNMTIDTHLSWEYHTNSQFVQSRLSGSTLESLHQAMRLVTTQPFCVPNYRSATFAVTPAPAGQRRGRKKNNKKSAAPAPRGGKQAPAQAKAPKPKPKAAPAKGK